MCGTSANSAATTSTLIVPVVGLVLLPAPTAFIGLTRAGDKPPRPRAAIFDFPPWLAVAAFACTLTYGTITITSKSVSGRSFRCAISDLPSFSLTSKTAAPL